MPLPIRHKLNIAFLVEGLTIPEWQVAIIEEVLQSDVANVSLTIIRPSRRPNSLLLKVLKYVARLSKRYRRVDDTGADACALRNTDSLLSGVERVTAESDSSKITEALRRHRVDLVLALGDVSEIGSIVDTTSIGVWFYDHSMDPLLAADSNWISVREVLLRRPHLRSALVMRSSLLDNDCLIYESFSPVHTMSLRTTRNEHLWKIRAFIPRVLKSLAEKGSEEFLQDIRGNPSNVDPDSPTRNAGLKGVGYLVWATNYVVWRLMQKVDRRLYEEKWTLLYQRGGDIEQLDQYTELRPPISMFWADPHLVRHSSGDHVFFEEASVETGHGSIAVLRLDESGACGEPRTVLKQPYHLSYPFIFEHREQLYMIVESAENSTIEVYRCIAFPYDWEFECNLMENLSAYDATLLQHNDLWWLFANVGEHQGASTCDELCLFYSDDPLAGNWRPHPRNPIISDIRRARPAGKIIVKDGQLLRPSQNSSVRYGYGLNINEIQKLTTTDYEERILSRIEPGESRSIKGVHTITTDGDLTLIDAFIRIRR